MNLTDLIQAIQGGLIQQDRLIQADIPSLPANTLVPRRAVTCSEIGRDFSVTLDLVSTAGDVELKTLIAQPMALQILQGDKSYLPIHGYIHTARRLGSDGSFTTYQLTFASWMHFLRFRSDMRYWQDRPADSIIGDVFNQHPQAKGCFQFVLSKPLPSRSYCRQSESDWNFVHRLMEEEGLFGFWRQAKDGKSHTLIVTDDIYSLDKASPNSIDFYRSGSGSEIDAFTQWAGSRTLQSSTYTTRTFDYKAPSVAANPKGTTLPTMSGQGNLPEQTEIYEYTGAYTYPKQDRGEQLSRIHLEEWESRAKRFFASGGVRGLDAGQSFVLAGHPEHDRDPAGQREFAAIKLRRYIENNLPLSDHEASFPYSLQYDLAQAKARNTGDPIAHEDGSTGFYLAEVEAQRVTMPYRSPFDHKKPEMELETAIVVGPQGEEVYTDELNRVKVMFVWDRQNPGDASASCWVRVAQSDTGGGYGSVHVPRIGEEVLVGYIGGDCDRPIVLHRVYNGKVQPQWHSDGIVSGYRTKEYGGSGYNQIVLDDATGQNRVQLYSSSAQTHLHLGYLIQHSDNARGAFLGSGFDLKSEAYGAIRAGQGLLLSTHAASVNQPWSVTAASEQLTGAESIVELTSQASASNQAESLDEGHEALKKFTDATQYSVAGGAGGGGRTAGGGAGNANGFSTPIMLMASPAGVGVSTQDSAQITANQQVSIVSGKSTHVAAGKSLVASVMEKISLFAQNAGIKLFASKGKVEIQAQSDEMKLGAMNDMTITSSNGRVVISAEKEVWIGAGGSYIKITSGLIENGTSGQILEKCASWDKPGASSMRIPAPIASVPNGCAWKTASASADSASSIVLE
ncbi:type VI secretion system Vgr family protein [Burkholderia sp. Ac-20379]|uniref:type VI secretion system Vgr family protein n=1 Tax=Burkholderia sp. Ac-20379 TaxID=2703900 RepID=UPI00197E28D8|nr:type VI secretion system Vgr family protein [Burkholderia sp. Ac-20379]MBN3725183.1 type VI secretion system tip protein VgrG [Burkholderia sp. Ac-20379]